MYPCLAIILLGDVNPLQSRHCCIIAEQLLAATPAADTLAPPPQYSVSFFSTATHTVPTVADSSGSAHRETTSGYFCAAAYVCEEKAFAVCDWPRIYLRGVRCDVAFRMGALRVMTETGIKSMRNHTPRQRYSHERHYSIHVFEEAKQC